MAGTDTKRRTNIAHLTSPVTLGVATETVRLERATPQHVVGPAELVRRG